MWSVLLGEEAEERFQKDGVIQVSFAESLAVVKWIRTEWAFQAKKVIGADARVKEQPGTAPEPQEPTVATKEDGRQPDKKRTLCATTKVWSLSCEHWLETHAR